MIRKFLGDFAAYGLGDLIIKASVFITLPVYSRVLTTEDYGEWNILVTGVGLLSAFLVLGGDAAYARLFFTTKTHEEQQTMTSTWFAFLALWSSSLVLICVLFSRPIAAWALDKPEHASLVILSLLAAPFGLINSMCAQALRNRFQARQFVFWNVTSAVLSIGFSVFAAGVLQWGIGGILAGALLANVLMLPIRLWTIRDLIRLRFSFDILKQLLKFGVPLVPTSLAYWIFASSDRILLGQLADLSQVGLYAVANQITSALGFLYGAMGQAWSPRAVALYEVDAAQASQVFGQMLTYFLIFFGVLCVGVSAFGYEMIKVLSTPEYYPAAAAVGPLALGFVAYASTQVTGIAISLKNRTYYFAAFSWVAAILNVILNILFIPQFGLMATAWSTAASYIFLTVGYAFVSQRLWAITYEMRRVLLVVGLTLAFTIAAPLLPQTDLLMGILIKSAYCLLFVGMLVLLGVVNRREWNAIAGILQPLRARVTS